MSGTYSIIVYLLYYSVMGPIVESNKTKKHYEYSRQPGKTHLHVFTDFRIHFRGRTSQFPDLSLF